MVIKTATYVHSEDFQDKRFLKQCTMFQPPSDFEMKKRAFSQKKNFFRAFTTRYRASGELFGEKLISLSKKFYSFSIIFGG